VTNTEDTVNIVRIYPDIENEGKICDPKKAISFIFNRQHKVQKNLMTFLG